MPSPTSMSASMASRWATLAGRPPALDVTGQAGVARRPGRWQRPAGAGRRTGSRQGRWSGIAWLVPRVAAVQPLTTPRPSTRFPTRDCRRRVGWAASATGPRGLAALRGVRAGRASSAVSTSHATAASRVAKPVLCSPPSACATHVAPNCPSAHRESPRATDDEALVQDLVVVRSTGLVRSRRPRRPSAASSRRVCPGLRPGGTSVEAESARRTVPGDLSRRPGARRPRRRGAGSPAMRGAAGARPGRPAPRRRPWQRWRDGPPP